MLRPREKVHRLHLFCPIPMLFQPFGIPGGGEGGEIGQRTPREKQAACLGRVSDETQLVLDELAECVAGSESPETELLRKELTASLNRFLRKLPEKDRTVFLLRYYYAGTKEDIARKTGLSSNQVKYILQKVRKQLADTLKKEGLQ